MSCEVEVRSVMRTVDLAPTEREEKFDIASCLCIVSELLMIVETEMFLCNAEIHIILMTVVFEILVKIGIRALLTEGLELHLLELDRSESEVARGDLISESLTDLTDAERELSPHATLYIQVVNIFALRVFGTKINNALCIVRNSPVCLEHKIKFSDVRKIMFTAVRTWNRMSLDVIKHLLLRHTVRMSLRVKIVDELVCSVTHFALLTVKKRVGETGNVTACLPNFRVHKYVRINLIAVLSFLNKTLSPGVLDIVFKSCSERAVIPCVCKTAVNIAACKNKSSVFAKGNNLVHSLFCIR